MRYVYSTQTSIQILVHSQFNRVCVYNMHLSDQGIKKILLSIFLCLFLPFYSVSRAKEIAMTVLPVVVVAGLAIGIGYFLYRRFKK